MSFYNEGSSQWSAPARQPSWEQQPPPSRSGNSSTVQQSDPQAFASQYEEVDRAQDNLLKSGKMFGYGAAGNTAGPNRRDSMPTPGRGYGDFDPRMGGGPQRHHSVSEYDGMRPHSASNLQGYYQNQRYGPRPNEGNDMIQAKRRMAAQRERELRNYHQEQQYNRNVSGGKSDRSISPNAMSEEDRRELIARQHRALYGDNSSLYANDQKPPTSGAQQPNTTTRTSSQDVRVASASAARGSSPLAFDPFGTGASNNSDGAVQMPPRDQMAGSAAKDQNNAGPTQRSRANSTSSPSSNPTTSYTLYDNAQQSSRTSTSSPGGSPPRTGGAKPPTAAGVAPIGTRPAASQQQSGGPMNKRSNTPLPSPLSYGFSASDAQGGANEPRSASGSNGQPQSAVERGAMGWGSQSGVWGKNSNSLSASVWG